MSFKPDQTEVHREVKTAMKTKTHHKLFVLTAAIACSAVAVNAASYYGEYGYALELNVNGVDTLYGLQVPGSPDESRLVPSYYAGATDYTSWADGSEAAPVLDLGSFDPGAGDTLVLNGGSELTYADVGAGGHVDGGYLNYRVFAGTGSAAVAAAPGFGPGIFMAADSWPGGPGNDTRLAVTGQNVDLLAGLSPGVYTLGSYGYAYGMSDSVDSFETWASNGGANYGATFTVVPEPTTFALAGIGLAGLLTGFLIQQPHARRRQPGRLAADSPLQRPGAIFQHYASLRSTSHQALAA